jgi:hypothetical protein
MKKLRRISLAACISGVTAAFFLYEDRHDSLRNRWSIAAMGIAAVAGIVLFVCAAASDHKKSGVKKPK